MRYPPKKDGAFYLKHKICFLKQIYSNSLTKNIFETLITYYKNMAPPGCSKLHQLNVVRQMIGYETELAYLKASILKNDTQYKRHDEDLLNSLYSIINNFNSTNFLEISKNLNDVLKISFSPFLFHIKKRVHHGKIK